MGHHTRRPRILLVEDEPHVYLTLQRRLEEHYEVVLATTYADAQQQLNIRHFHLAILDVRLQADDENDQSGIRLLAELESLGLRGITPGIIMTAYGTTTMVIQALQNLGADKFIEKRPGYISELLDAIPEVLSKYKVNFGLEYVVDTPQKITQGAHFIRSEEPGWPAPAQLVPQIEDVLGQLFYGARRLWIDRSYAGLSGSFVMQAHPTWPTGLGQSMIVKIGRRDKTEVEERNYRNHVEHFLHARHATRLNVAYSRHLGGLLYTFVDTEAEETLTFGDFYHHHPLEAIQQALHHLFDHTCRLWYQARTPPDYECLRDLYLEAFNLRHQPDRLANEITSLRPDYDPRSPTLSFAAPQVTLPNPLWWLANDANTVMPVCRSITHGDLHADNILMNDEGDCWLIDFYRTYQSHILRDFIELETDIKFRLMEPLPPEEFQRFEQALIHLDHPQLGVTLPPDLPAGAHKAAHVIAGLRAEAWHLLETTQRNPRVQQREYLTGLLMGTLNIVRMRHYKEDPALQPRRELALLSSALICQYLH